MSAETKLANLEVAVEIERFLSGESDGAPLFQALYGAAADEPVPERLRALMRECCEPEALPSRQAKVTAPVCGAALS